MPISCLLKVSYLHPLVPRLRLILQHLTSKIKANLIIDYHFQVHLLNYNFITISIDWQCAPSSLFNHHLRSVEISIITPIHPEPASHHRRSSISQCSWQGGNWSPGCCSREESQHRRKAVGSIKSSGNKKLLQSGQVFKKTRLEWSHPSGKSRTGMVLSILRQLGELLDKPAYVVPATLCCQVDTRICFIIFIFIAPLSYEDSEVDYDDDDDDRIAQR